MIRAWLAAALLAIVALPALAGESAPVQTVRDTVTLIGETDAVDGTTPFRLGLHFKLAPGWHIYWSNPGDAGTPPMLDLHLPKDAKASDFAWPTPTRIAEGSVMTFAYTGDVVLPLTVTPVGAGPMTIDADASWLICQHICIPEEGKFHLDLKQGTAQSSAEAPLFAAADLRMPRPSPFAATIAADGTLNLTGAGLSGDSAQEAWFFPDVAGLIDQGAAQRLSASTDGIHLTLTPGPNFTAETGLSGVLVLKDRAGLETALTIMAAPGGAPAAAATGLAMTLLLALAGGLILNLMPCVFPILAMKAMSLARLSGAEHGEVRAHALSYTIGVLAAFGSLGAVLLGLRAAGNAVGWGFQFQSPLFVVAMAWLLFAIGLNLSGLFTVGGSVIGAGQGLTARGGHAGSFFTGVLAVVVATPCTAPFMAAALAAALTASAPVTMTIFLALGLGLAAPYALLALLPGLARRLPRPGRWMDVLKQALAFPMYGAVAWLVWVMSEETGPSGVLSTVVGLVLLGLAFWAFGLAQGSAGNGARIGRAVGLIALAAAGFVLTMVSAAPAPTAAAATDGSEPFSPARLATLRDAGQPVFIDMTAAWCVTCLVNERVALAPDAVRQAFAQHHVAYLKGDWTRQDPAITQFLHEHAHDGVPLYLLYPSGAGAPETLPQILTEGMLLDRLGRLTS